MAGAADSGGFAGDAATAQDASMVSDADGGGAARAPRNAGKAPETPKVLSAECGLTEPPQVVMKTSSGEQEGVNGSYCAGHVGCGSSVCADRGGGYVRQYTIVHAEDEITLSMPAGAILDRDNMSPLVNAQKICQRNPRTVASVAFHEDQPWKVSFPQGTYILSADYRFAGDEGVNGSGSAAFGLVVDDQRERGIVAANELTFAEDCTTPAQPGPDADAGI